MKIINDFTRKVAVLLFASMALLVSCNDEGKLEGNDLPVVIADSLANAFAEQVAAMRLMSTETPADVSYAVLREAGDAVVSLSDGTSFVSYPEDVEYYPVLAQSVENGAACWALLDKEGNAELLKGADGEVVLMSEDIALKLTSKGYAVVVGDSEFDTVFEKDDKIQAFACDFHMDAESKIYAVTFVFAEDFSKSYPSKNYNSVGFLLPYDLEGDYISEFFVNCSSTSSLVLEIPAGVAYTLETTVGWKVAPSTVDAVTFDVTAPAEIEGESVLKVISQECGVALAELSLVSEPFRSLFSSTTDAFIDPSVGLRKFVYGLSEYLEYDIEEVLDLSEGIVAGTSEPQAGCAVAEESVKVSLAELLGAELDPDKRYVLWAVPALYREGEDAGYYVEEGLVCTYEFGAMAFNLELIQAKILDAEITVSANGVEAVFGGVVPKSEYAMELVASKLRNGYFTSLPAADGEFSFNGLMSAYPGGSEVKNEILPSTTYLVWVAPAFSGDYPYEVDDLTYIEVTTEQVAEGGSVELTIEDPIMGRDEISAQISAPGASLVYYAIVSNTIGKDYQNALDRDKFDLIMKNTPVMEMGTLITATLDKLKPSTTYWIYATAIDADGKYGPIKCVSGKTNGMKWDSITLTVSTSNIGSNKIEYKVTSDKGDLSDYIYWVGPSNDPFWANSNYCGGTLISGQVYMALNPDDENIRKAMNKYGPLSEDGTLLVSGLMMDTEYAFIILEKGEEEYSKGFGTKVKTTSVDFGEIVKEGTPEWIAAKNAVRIEWCEDKFVQDGVGDSATYEYDFFCPDTLTAYVLSASEEYFSGAGITMMSKIMVAIEETASGRWDNGYTPLNPDGSLMQEPSYYKKGVLCDGHLMNVCDYYTHGIPKYGYVTYFARDSHGEGNCIHWEKGQCSTYQRALERIKYNMTLEPYLSKAEEWGMEGDEAAAFAESYLAAYTPFYEDAKPIFFVNDGSGIHLTAPYATGYHEDTGVVPDRVVVMLKDLQGNYYEPMWFEVPNYF